MGSVQAQRQLRQEMLPVYRQHILYRIYHVGMLSVVNLPPLYLFCRPILLLEQRELKERTGALRMQVKKGCGQ